MRYHSLKRLHPLLALCLVIGLCALSLTDLTPALPAQTKQSEQLGGAIREDEVIVQLKAGASSQALSTQYNTVVQQQLEGTNFYLMKIAEGRRVEDVLEALSKNTDVLSASPNYVISNAEVQQRSQAYIDQRSQAYIDGQSPPDFYGQASLAQLHLGEAQQHSGGAGIKVAVIDTGIDFAHPLFAGRIACPCRDYVDNDSTPQEVAGGPGYGHGTFVAGIVALTAPQAQILPLRAFNADGAATSFDIARAILFATLSGAKVINMSFGMSTPDPLINAMLNLAYGQSYMVAAAGNDDAEALHFPASQTNRTLAVTSTTNDDRKAAFANYHLNTRVAAPGVNVYSAYPGGLWAYWSGTSFSTPLVAGEAALLLALRPSWSSSTLTTAITSSGVNIDALNPLYVLKLGQVRIDYLDAVNYALTH